MVTLYRKNKDKWRLSFIFANERENSLFHIAKTHRDSCFKAFYPKLTAFVDGTMNQRVK